jgi:hypothetical protein
MFGQPKPKTPEVLHHWYTLVENFQTSPQDFYTAVEKSLQDRKVPGLEAARVEFLEGGLLSAKREYLRLTREHLVFDICAAPFGTSFFFSSRFAELPLQITPDAVMAILFILALMLWAFAHIWGWFWGIVALLVVLLATSSILRNAVSIGLQDLDAWLIKQPGVGGIYELLFRKDTYYRQDTRLMYLETVPAVVKQIVEELTAAKGIKLTRQYEQAPIRGDLSTPPPPAQIGK